MKSVVVSFNGKEVTLLCNNDGAVSKDSILASPAAVKAGLTAEALKAMKPIELWDKGTVVDIGGVHVKLSNWFHGKRTGFQRGDGKAKALLDEVMAAIKANSGKLTKAEVSSLEAKYAALQKPKSIEQMSLEEIEAYLAAKKAAANA